MLHILQTEVFSKWLSALRDARSKARIVARIESARMGNLGDVKPLGGSISEMRIDVGAGYRVYFVRRGAVVVVLLCGGDKSTQGKDIVRAKRMARELEEE
jgi:putative addiction module killer protein